MKFKETIPLIAVSVMLIWGYKQNSNTEQNFKNGLLAAFITIVASSLLMNENPKAHFINKRFCNIALNVMKIYAGFMIYVYFQNAADARYIFAYMENSENIQQVQKELHTYEQDCEFVPSKLWEEVDHFFWTHFFGWFSLYFALRDWKYCFMLATFDEFFELTFKYILPHLGECWYDSWIMDLIVSNGFGILFAYLINKYILKFETYDYFGSNNTKSISEWKLWHNPTRIKIFISITFLKMLFLANSFFGMNGLWVTPKTVHNIIRLFMWGTINMYVIGTQCYHYILLSEGERKKPKGIIDEPQMNIMVTIMSLIEFGNVIKFSPGAGNYHENPELNYKMLIFWGTFFGGFLLRTGIKKTINQFVMYNIQRMRKFTKIFYFFLGFTSGLYIRNEFIVPTHQIVYNDLVNKFDDDLQSIAKSIQSQNKFNKTKKEQNFMNKEQNLNKKQIEKNKNQNKINQFQN